MALKVSIMDAFLEEHCSNNLCAVKFTVLVSIHTIQQFQNLEEKYESGLIPIIITVLASTTADIILTILFTPVLFTPFTVSRH